MDLTNMQRHKNRALVRSQDDCQLWVQPSQALAVLPRADELELLFSFDNKPLVGCDEIAAVKTELAPEVSGTNSRRTEAGEISAKLKEILNQCLHTVDAERGVQSATHLATTAAQTPAELLLALNRVVARSSRMGLGNDSVSSEQEHLAADAQVAVPVTRRVAAFATNSRRRFVPTITKAPDGLRFESFVDGAEITKDAFGRVLEVHSAFGESLALKYDSKGNLESFYRKDSKGRVHSSGKRDRHGVVVRDPDGRALAVGESMTVDPHGCVAIHNHDGQIVSIDLVRRLHIERRKLGESARHQGAVTAVFTHDGFRMMTHFHDVSVTDGEQVLLPCDKVSRLRFYGRDGSLVEFMSEDELLALRPERVLPPASCSVKEMWRGRWQGGTAWEAVQEYLDLLV